jgi:hypothetical protein
MQVRHMCRWRAIVSPAPPPSVQRHSAPPAARACVPRRLRIWPAPGKHSWLSALASCTGALARRVFAAPRRGKLAAWSPSLSQAAQCPPPSGTLSARNTPPLQRLSPFASRGVAPTCPECGLAPAAMWRRAPCGVAPCLSWRGAVPLVVWRVPPAVWRVPLAVWRVPLAVWRVPLAVWRRASRGVAPRLSRCGTVPLAVWRVPPAVWRVPLAVWRVPLAVWRVPLAVWRGASRGVARCLSLWRRASRGVARCLSLWRRASCGVAAPLALPHPLALLACRGAALRLPGRCPVSYVAWLRASHGGAPAALTERSRVPAGAAPGPGPRRADLLSLRVGASTPRAARLGTRRRPLGQAEARLRDKLRERMFGMAGLSIGCSGASQALVACGSAVAL